MATDSDGHAVPSELRRPSIDEETEAVLDEAVASLGALRGLEWLGDDGVVVHLLASLIAQAENLLGEASTRTTPGPTSPVSSAPARPMSTSASCRDPDVRLVAAWGGATSSHRYLYGTFYSYQA